MEMSGERVIEADRAKVWEALNDPEILKACIPGCQSMEKTSETGFEAVVKQKVGPVSATFKGAVELSDIVVGESYKISGEGKGGAAGFAKGGADVRLEDVEDGTKLSYAAEAKVGGKLAQLGSRLIDGFAKKMADQFFDRFKSEVEGPKPEPAAQTSTQPASEDGAPAAPEAEEDTPKKSWLGRLIGS
ncbi:MAG: CoxG family protein [Pikeienuella sp.]